MYLQWNWPRDDPLSVPDHDDQWVAGGGVQALHVDPQRRLGRGCIGIGEQQSRIDVVLQDDLCAGVDRGLHHLAQGGRANLGAQQDLKFSLIFYVRNWSLWSNFDKFLIYLEIYLELGKTFILTKITFLKWAFYTFSWKMCEN